MRRLLLAGKNGQVGFELQRALAPLGEVVAVDPADKAESEPDLALAINARRPANSRPDTTRFRSAFGLRLPRWQEGVRHILQPIL